MSGPIIGRPVALVCVFGRYIGRISPFVEAWAGGISEIFVNL